MLFFKLKQPDIERGTELDKIELKYSLKIPEEYKDFFLNHELSIFNTNRKEFVGYTSEKISDYEKRNGPILISHFSDIYDIKRWYEDIFPIGFSNGEGLKIVETYGSTFILLIANKNSINYGKVLYFDLEMLGENHIVLENSFLKFLNNIKAIPE